MPLKTSHRILVAAVTVIFAVLAIASVTFAVLNRMGRVHISHLRGIGLIAAWMFLPPIISIAGRVWLFLSLDEQESEQFNRRHDIVRHCWLAVVVLLVVLLGGGMKIGL